MKKVSTVALAAALVVSIGGAAIVSPAFAKKKEEEAAKPAPLNLSKEVRASAVAAQTALAAKDFATAETNITALEAAAKNDDERLIGAQLRINLESQKISAQPAASQDQTPLAKPLDSLIANPNTPKDALGKYMNARANIYANAKQYKEALDLYTRARAAGYTDENLALNVARMKMESGDIRGGATEMDAAIKGETAAGRKAPEAWYRYVIARLYKANALDETDNWTRNWLAAYGTKENWRDAIFSFGFSGSGAKRLTDRQRVDLYRLMRATNSLGGQKEYIDYADSAVKIGLPTEAETVVQEGFDNKAIPAGNVSATDLKKQAKEAIAADKPLATQEKLAAGAAKGDLAAQAGDSYLGLRNYPKAIELYRLALSKGGIDLDPVKLHLGIALALSGNKDEAKTNFDAVTTTPNTAVAKLWTTYLITPPTAQ